MAAPLPDPNKTFPEQGENILATMLVFGEAAGQFEDARIGVLNSAKNRLRFWRPEYGARTLTDIILRPGSYDCFVSLKDKLLNPLKYERVETWNACYQVATDILNGLTPDNIERCTLYYDQSLDSNPPYWAKPPILGQLTEYVKDLGDFHFLRYIEHHALGGINGDAHFGG